MHEGVCTGRIRLETRDCLHIARALQPDNESTPPHIRVECRGVGEALECEVRVEGCGDPRRILTLRNTVDDLLASVKAAAESLGDPGR